MNDLSWYRGKRVCVTGATGLIGNYAWRLLDQAGAIHSEISHEGCDLLIPDEIAGRFDGMDAVINCAGITGGVGLTDIDPVSYVGPATAMMCNVLHACHLVKVPRLGFLSSTTVYAPADLPCVEGSPLETLELYPKYRGIGESKRFLEQLCRYYHETTGIGIGIVRPSGAYGRYDNFDERTSHVVPGMINRALRLKPGDPFEVWGDGRDVRDVIHAEDVARGLLLAVAHRPDCTPLNIASGQGVTTMALANEILTAVGSAAEIRTNPDKPTALKSRTVDISRARELLGFEPMISLADGIKDTVEWRRAQQ